MERFDWMGGNVASVSFSLDNGPVQDAAWVLRPAPESMLPPKPRAADEKQFHDGCFEGHRRLEVSSATLQPRMWTLSRMCCPLLIKIQVNAHGWPLTPQEHDTSRIVITLRRGRKGITKDSLTGEARYNFIPATGAAAFPTNVVFYYDSTCQYAR